MWTRRRARYTGVPTTGDRSEEWKEGRSWWERCDRAGLPLPSDSRNTHSACVFSAVGRLGMFCALATADALARLAFDVCFDAYFLTPLARAE